MAKSFDDLLERTTTPAVRARIRRRERELLAGLLLSEMRQLTGMSQRELAAALGVRQPSLSKLEHQSDMQVATLRRIIEALGGELQLVAKFPRATVRVRQFDKPRPARAAPKPRVGAGRKAA